MAKQIEDRYASMTELSEALEESFSATRTIIGAAASTSPDESVEPAKQAVPSQGKQLAHEGLGARFTTTWCKTRKARVAYLWMIAVLIASCAAFILYRESSSPEVDRNLASRPDLERQPDATGDSAPPEKTEPKKTDPDGSSQKTTATEKPKQEPGNEQTVKPMPSTTSNRRTCGSASASSKARTTAPRQELHWNAIGVHSSR